MIKKNTFIIAEVGLAHDGSLGIAKSFIDNISNAGADAVKFQIHDASTESSSKENFKKKFSSQDKSRYYYWERTKFHFDEWKHLINYANKKKLKFIISPFSIESFDILKKLNIYAWKIASGEFTNLPLIEHIVKNSKRPLILSTGLTYEKEIEIIIKKLNPIRNKTTLLQCTSAYPTPLESVGHNCLKYFKRKYKVNVGISDHSGNKNSIIAGICMGADTIETHVTYHKSFFGPDTKSSITFDELREVINFRNDYKKIVKGKINKKKLNSNQKIMRNFFCKSILSVNNMEIGHKIKLEDIKFRKPLIGISAFDYRKIIGKKVKNLIMKDQFIKWQDIN